MIKTITITLILCSLILSCGKKEDPVYKESKGKFKLYSVLKNKV